MPSNGTAFRGSGMRNHPKARLRDFNTPRMSGEMSCSRTCVPSEELSLAFPLVAAYVVAFFRIL
jgi:hypothetical protein